MNEIKEKIGDINGAEFLIKEASVQDTFSPEEFSEEQNMIKETVREFNKTEIFPFTAKIEKQVDNIAGTLLEKFGELGLLSTHMPEEYGGMDLDFNTNTIIGEEVGPSGSFSVAYNAHTGIGMLPILYFGTDSQKEKYLPGLITGELKASYCLTEPSSGSDALSAKANAVLSEDGKHYILNGQKMWITNAGFADVFTVFAQVDGDKFTGFIVDKGLEGFTLGAEEDKLGIKGSSTRMVFLENVKVPVENLLGEIGKGHQIAFNVLNTGRFKLGASVLGGSKMSAKVSIDYASYSEAKLKAAEEFALECSIVKVLGSEVLDYCVDEAVQIHGGMGYSEEGSVARAYRDSRINRIFEGTNEINRLVILSTVLKKAMKGQLDIVTPALAVQSELKNETTDVRTFDEPYGMQKQSVANFKKVLLMILGSAAKLSMEGKLDLKKEQELLINMADIVIDIFSVESSVLRASKIKQNGNEQVDSDVYSAMINMITYEASHRIYKNALDAISVFVKEEKQGDFIAGFRLFTKYPLQNVKDLRRTIARAMITEGDYCF